MEILKNPHWETVSASMRLILSCLEATVAEIIGRKWVSLIVRDLSNGAQRFNVLQNSLGISPRVLSSRLQELEEDGLISREIFAEVPPRVEYTLTERGRLLIPLIEEMRRIGKHFIPAA
jgi:DNA-binding HxlR family transcriptional regulator